MEKTIVTWRKVMSLCSNIVAQLKDKYPNVVDYDIVGLSRGGLVPGVIISNMLNVRQMHALGMRSYADQEKTETHVYQVPDIASMRKILLIDDISDTGESFKQTHEMLVNKEVITVSLFLKEKTKFVPNVYGKKVKHDQWVVFPWE
ncbi:hypothetical protein EBR43_05795 [bacterium]|nr:hypothetical protein [bacterium]